MRAKLSLVGFAFFVSCTSQFGEGTDNRVPDDWTPAPDPAWDVGSEPSFDTSTPPPSAPPNKFAPEFGPTVTADKAPPAISGGTLAISRDGLLAIASDPDRDQIHVAELTKLGGTTFDLNVNDEPGRVVVDNGSRAHVALRRGGAIVTIDLLTRKLTSRRAVCPAPRGIAFDEARDVLHVACAGGELVTLATTGAITRTVRLERDLRDVVVRGDKLYVSTFRSAKLLEVGADGTVANTRSSGKVWVFKQEMAAHVAWRTIPDPMGGIMMMHQRSVLTPISTDKGGYGGGGPCESGIVQGTVSQYDDGNNPPTPRLALQRAVLPVDIAITADGNWIAVVSAANTKNIGLPPVQVFPRDTVLMPADGPCSSPSEIIPSSGEPIAVAFVPKTNKLVIQSREPSMLILGGVKIPLSSVSRADTGHAVFHANSGIGVACASCHPEGGDDGHVWNFAGIGPRRTQTFRGGLLGTEPLHWDGDMENVTTLVDKVFVGRMSGLPLDSAKVAALSKWMDAIPTIPSVAADAAAAARGEGIFKDVNVGCASCHSGKALTNNASVNVGTGKNFQVPSLRGIAWRAPFMHDGCAPTLFDRFGTCGGGDNHGKTAHLSATQIKDLVSYLETL
jgi:mono/diheme cytochrome c family protein